MGYHTNPWPLRNALVRPDFVQLVWSDLEIKPADIKLFDLLGLGLLSETGCVVLPSIWIRQETWINLSLLEPQLL